MANLLPLQTGKHDLSDSYECFDAYCANIEQCLHLSNSFFFFKNLLSFLSLLRLTIIAQTVVMTSVNRLAEVHTRNRDDKFLHSVQEGRLG